MSRVLLIEDEAAIREEVLDWLRFEGYEAVGAANGRLGLQMARETLPDLILCDITMPEMNGHEVLLEVRGSPDLSHVPFIFVTAAADRTAVRAGMNLGADDYLSKPFTRAEMLNAIQSQLQKHALKERQVREQMDSFSRAFQEEQEKRLSKSRLIAMFSHDFRNPLSLILLSAGMLYEGEAQQTTTRRQRQYDRIRGSVYLLLQMLDDMVVTAEMENGHLAFAPEPTAVAGLVKTLVDEFRIIDQDYHKLVYQAALPDMLQIDPKLFRQILANLLSNALKYAPPGTQVTVRLYQAAGDICLEVQDQGMGIPAEERSHLFEPFYRASNARNIKGSGLGLMIVKECVDQHRGCIEVHSEVEQGTRFTVRLPAVAA
ncbi:MAG: hybrid sensor histidine kinase/response regulator [Anaerolineales bacterium]|nr:hybrid sensor histidine kinase/response regulator [Anaerolineales bacterium]